MLQKPSVGFENHNLNGPNEENFVSLNMNYKCNLRKNLQFVESNFCVRFADFDITKFQMFR